MKTKEKVSTKQRIMRDEGFYGTMMNGSWQLHNYLDGKSLTPFELILAKCAYCIHVVKNRTLPDCPDKHCPLYRFMCREDTGKKTMKYIS